VAVVDEDANCCVLPEIGSDLAFWPGSGHYREVAPIVHQDLVEYLTRSTALSTGEAARVVAEVVDYFAEPVPDFVRRRHAELRLRGLPNETIFTTIGAELSHRRFAAPDLTPRQLRRLVYG